MQKTSARNRILDAALACVSERGIQGTTIEAIRERGGVSVGSLYHHFDGRQAILAALFIEGVNDFGERALAALEHSRSLDDGVRALVGTYLAWVEEKPDWARFLLSARPLVEREAADALRERNRLWFRALRAWLQRWPETRPLARRPVLALAWIFGPAEYLARLWLDGVLPGNPSDHADELAGAAVAAIRGGTP